MLSVTFLSATTYLKTMKQLSPYIKKAFITANLMEELAKISVDLFVICWIFKSSDLGHRNI
jgi:hypothetical protein